MHSIVFVYLFWESFFCSSVILHKTFFKISAVKNYLCKFQFPYPASHFHLSYLNEQFIKVEKEVKNRLCYEFLVLEYFWEKFSSLLDKATVTLRRGKFMYNFEALNVAKRLVVQICLKDQNNGKRKKLYVPFFSFKI